MDAEVPLFHVGNGAVVFLHAGKDAVPGLRHAEVGLVELDLEICLAGFQLSDLFLE